MPQDPDIERILLTGVVALMSAVVGGSIVAMVNAWNQRRLTRDTELRKWRLEQLRPTLERANRALARFEELDELYHRLNREGGDEARAAFARHVRWEANPFSNLSHSIVMARVGTDKIQDSLNRFFVFIQRMHGRRNSRDEQKLNHRR